MDRFDTKSLHHSRAPGYHATDSKNPMPGTTLVAKAAAWAVRVPTSDY